MKTLGHFSAAINSGTPSCPLCPPTHGNPDSPPGSTDKLYALHAPEVECIAKGKARTRYELGVKTSIAVANARTAGGQFIVGMQELPGNPYDGHTLSGQIEQVERLTGVSVERAYVDRGYKRATSMPERPR